MNSRRRTFLGGMTVAVSGAWSVAKAGPVSLLSSNTVAAPDAVVPLPLLPAMPRSADPIAGPQPELPRWQRFAVAPPPTNGKPAICIVIDDLGVMHRGTERTVALPAPLTLSWFPFARRLNEQVAEAMAVGHENTLHMPMQSFSNGIAQTGPDPLRIDLPPAENIARLRAAIAAVPNTVGLNNHMGSVATRDPALMDIVAAEARANGMLFLDSLVIGHSVAAQRAEAAGVPTASRDIFIDNTANAGMIREQLDLIEKHARKYGHVIAIGHPRPLTLDALEAWMPTLAGKGFVLWPLSATVAWRNEIVMPQTLL